MKMPNSVCWNITKRCNENCLYCYRDQDSEELLFDDKRKVIDKVMDAGIYKLTFAGGEPLLVAEIRELIQYAKFRGLIVSLTTNGMLLKDELLDFCLENLDWLTLSLDGADEDIQTMMTRSTGHVKRVSNILSYAESFEKKKCKIKINTVVSDVNKNQVADIARIISTFHVDRWKLFQFVPLRGMAKKYESLFYISDQYFDEVIKEIRKCMGEGKTIISISNRQNIESAYFVIFPNGDIKISQGLKDQVIGNALTDDLKQLWENELYQKFLHEERTKFLINNKQEK